MKVFCQKDGKRGFTTSNIPIFNLLDYKYKGFNMERIRMAILRAKQDYGKVFEKLAKE